MGANDMEQSFLEAGADHFIFKPFPTKEEPLKRELKQLMFNDANTKGIAAATTITANHIQETQTGVRIGNNNKNKNNLMSKEKEPSHPKNKRLSLINGTCSSNELWVATLGDTGNTRNSNNNNDDDDDDDDDDDYNDDNF